MGYRMYLSFLLLATLTSSFIPNCLASTFIGKCKDFGKVNGELSATIVWECFPNNTKSCITMTEDCRTCDGKLTTSSFSCHSGNCIGVVPETQAGRFRRRRYRYKREVSGRRRPRIGRGEAKDSDKAANDAKDDKEEAKMIVGNAKTEEATDKVGKKTSKVITCADVCLEKGGKHSKGKFVYTSFLGCDGVAKV